MSDTYKQPVYLPKVPARYEEAKWEDVPENIIKLFEQMPKSRKGLYIHGAVGTGKTHIVYALYRNAPIKCRFFVKETSRYSNNDEPSYKEIRALFWNSTELFREMRLDFDRPREERKRVEDALIEHEGLLFIDDIGSEKISDWVLETFYLIINKRYNEKLPIIFTSNYTVRELADRIGERIASRIVETCDIIKLEGGDRRVKKSAN